MNHVYGSKIALIALSVGIAACAATGQIPGAPLPTANTATTPATGTRGMVSSAHPMATEAGLDVLAAGGNAFDAAVAIAATLNVVEPMMSGMGGYGTILVHDAASGETWFLNCSGRIPRGVDADVFRAPTPNYRANRTGPKAVSTPGNANAWEALSRRYGRLDWADLFVIPTRLAEGGFPIDGRLAGSIRGAFDDFPAHAQAFYGVEGRPLREGEMLVQKDLAASFRAVAREGAGAIHGGEIGRTIDAAMREAGSFLTLEDLAENEAEWWEPSGIDYRGYRVLTASPPATAWPSLVRLSLMSQFDNRALGHNSVAYLHRFAEVTKHAFWCRLAYAGDPEIEPPPLDRLFSDAYAAEQVAGFDMLRASRFTPPGDISFEAVGENTTHFVVADAEGNIVTATQTLGNSFGSRLMAEGTGIWLNNSLAYCTFEPAGNPMDAHAGRRKLSGDCPTIIMKDGRPWVAFGTPGGHTIGQTTPQMVMNLIDFDMDVQQAIAAPRVSFVEPNRLAVESGVPDEVRAALASMGHVLQIRSLGNAHGLAIEYDSAGRPIRFTGGSDPRGPGLAQGR